LQKRPVILRSLLIVAMNKNDVTCDMNEDDVTCDVNEGDVTYDINKNKNVDVTCDIHGDVTGDINEVRSRV